MSKANQTELPTDKASLLSALKKIDSTGQLPEKSNFLSFKSKNLYTDIFHHICIEPTISVSAMKNTAEKYHLNKKETKQLLTEICAVDFIQNSWAEWTQVHQRSELHSRLEMLINGNHLSDALLPMIKFFFRASDPVLYQQAAILTGKHLSSKPALNQFFQNYCNQIHLSVEKPLSEVSHRSHRRVLITLAAAHQAGNFTTYPMSTDLLNSLHLLQPADLSVALLAITLTQTDDKESQSIITQQLKQFPALLAKKRLDKIHLKHWSTLIREETDFSHEEKVAFWIQMLEQINILSCEEESESFSKRLHFLQLMDELCLAFCQFDKDVRTQILKQITHQFPEDLAAFLFYRCEIGWQRTHKNSESEIERNRFENINLPGGLLYLSAYQQKSASFISGSTVENFQKSYLNELLSLFNKSNWHTQHPYSKAMVAFLLLDFSMHHRIKQKELTAITEAHGLKLTVTSGTESLQNGVPNKFTFHLITQMFSREKHESKSFIDSRMLHHALDLHHIMGVIIPGKFQEALYSVADVAEHQLRLKLLSEEDFNPYFYLLSLSIREPHPAFFQYFKKLIFNREYVNAQGASFALSDFIESLSTDSENIQEQAPEQFLQSSDENPLSSDFGNCALLLNRIRALFLNISSTESLSEKLSLFARLLQDDDNPEFSKSGPLLQLIGAMNQNEMVVTSASQVTHDLDFQSIHEKATAESIAIKKIVVRFRPEKLSQIQQAHYSSSEILSSLKVLNELLSNCLPSVERKLFLHTIQKLSQALVERSGEINELTKVMNHFSKSNHSEKLEKSWEKFLDQINCIQSGYFRKHLLELFSKFYFEGLGQSEATELEMNYLAKDWQLKIGFLRFASSERVRNQFNENDYPYWIDSITQQWCFMMSSAMEMGFESRVDELMYKNYFQLILENKHARQVLSELKKWWYDHYHPLKAAKAERALKKGKGLALSSIYTEFSGFFFSYTPVWLALLIGAILMLDFGDAWTSMADIGDVRGILITFTIGTTGAFLYIYNNLKSKINLSPEEYTSKTHFSAFLRSLIFLIACLIYSLFLTSMLWLLLSETDEVVHGDGAILHIVVWASFALFVGIFFGLIAKAD